MSSDRFLISALVDFPDDCGNLEFTPELVENLMERLRWMGVRRVYWNYYQPGMWSWFVKHSKTGTTKASLENLGGDPMPVGRRLAHKHGMEFYACIKPYETGASHSTPVGTPMLVDDPGIRGIGGRYHVDDWVARRPDLRVRARSGDVPTGIEGLPVTRIQLRQKDMEPIRIKAENLQIWTSEDNTSYTRKDVAFSMSEDVDTCPRDVVDAVGVPVSKAGDSVRVLNLTGFSLLDPFIAISTDFEDTSGTFRNTVVEMFRVFGPDDQQLPIVVASHKAIWRAQRDLRIDDLQYDGGLGDLLINLDVSNTAIAFPGWDGTGTNTRDGVVAFAKGRNCYLAGSLCEAYPEVQEYWMSWVGDCLAAGVDGMDVRISSHSSWTDWRYSFGFNEPVIAEYERRYGVNPDLDDFDPELLAELRGDAFDRFLQRAKHRLAAAGKVLQLHLEGESFRREAPQVRWRARPGIMNFHWQRWLQTGLADEATLFGRLWENERILRDPVYRQMIDEANAANIPVHLSKPVTEEHQGDWLEMAYREGSLSGYTFYETASMYDGKELAADSELKFNPKIVNSIRERAQNLGLLE